MERTNCCSNALGGGGDGDGAGSCSLCSSFFFFVNKEDDDDDEDEEVNLYIMGGIFCTNACNSLARWVMCSTVSLDATNSRYRDDNTKRNSVRFASASYNALACKDRISSILILCFKC